MQQLTKKKKTSVTIRFSLGCLSARLNDWMGQNGATSPAPVVRSVFKAVQAHAKPGKF